MEFLPLVGIFHCSQRLFPALPWPGLFWSPPSMYVQFHIPLDTPIPPHSHPPGCSSEPQALSQGFSVGPWLPENSVTPPSVGFLTSVFCLFRVFPFLHMSVSVVWLKKTGPKQNLPESYRSLAKGDDDLANGRRTSTMASFQAGRSGSPGF